MAGFKRIVNLLGVGDIVPTSTLHVAPIAVGDKGVTIEGSKAGTQTADLLEVKNTSDAVVLNVTAAGATKATELSATALTGTSVQVNTLTVVATADLGTAAEVDALSITGAAGLTVTATADLGTAAEVDSLNVTTAGGFKVSTKTPSASGDDGVAGTICWDASYLYVCTATNEWKRASVAAW